MGTQADEILASVMFGWMLGFTVFAVMNAVKQSTRWSTYIVLCWIGLFSCFAGAILDWLIVLEYIDLRKAYWSYIVIILLLCLQTQCLAQILVNRICLLLYNESHKVRLKVVTAAFFTVPSIGIIVLFILSCLRVPQITTNTHLWYNGARKIIETLYDIYLNCYFVWIVRDRLVVHGLVKYNKLVEFNVKIITLSVVIDCVLIGFLAYPNHFLPALVQSTLLIAKFQIEMTMSDLIVTVAKTLDDPISIESLEFALPTNIQVAVGDVPSFRHHSSTLKSLDGTRGQRSSSGDTYYEIDFHPNFDLEINKSEFLRGVHLK